MYCDLFSFDICRPTLWLLTDNNSLGEPVCDRKLGVDLQKKGGNKSFSFIVPSPPFPSLFLCVETMGEIPIKKVAPNLDPRGVDESTRIFYAEEFKRSSKEHTCAVSSNQQIMGQQEMTESINLEDIPRDCLPIALLQSETAAFEQFMMKPNVQDAQIWTVLGNFMHRSVAEAVNTVGSVSTSELEEHSKLKFLIWFFKEIQTIKASIVM